MTNVFLSVLGEPLPWLAQVSLVFLIAGMVKGVIGMGLPTVSVALLSMSMAPSEAAVLMIVPSLVTNVWQLMAGGRLGRLAFRLRWMLAGICGGTWAGVRLLEAKPLQGAAAALGIFLILYAAAGLYSLRLAVPARLEPFLSPLIGALTGGVTAATGIFVIPAVPYLQSLGLERDELVQALGIAFTTSTIALALSLASTGTLHLSSSGASALALLPALLGMYLGQTVRARVRPATFRLAFFIGLILLGLHLVLKEIIG